MGVAPEAGAKPDRAPWGAAKNLGEEALNSLISRFDGALARLPDARDGQVLRVEASKWLDVCRFLKEDASCQFDQIVLVSGLHWPGKEFEFEVVIQLRSVAQGRELELRCPLKGPKPEVPSLVSIWPGADWLERETYDLVGIHFAGHPDLRRILMAEGTQGHPLRKDHPRRAPKFSMRRGSVEGLPDILEDSPG